MLDISNVTVTKNPLVIYHSNCADGFSAAWCFYNAQASWETTYDFHPGVYSQDPPDCTGRVVYLVDFSYKRDVVMNICAVADKVILIDHHKTAIDDLAPLADKYSPLYQKDFERYTDLNRSGAMLAWDYLYNRYDAGGTIGPIWETYSPDHALYTAPPRLLTHIQDRDLWKFALSHTREISAHVFSFEYSFANWDILMRADATELLKMTVAGAAIERKHHKDVAELVKVCRRIATIACINVPVASLPYTYSSDAGHLMAKEYADGKYFAACYWDTPKGRTFSLRSTENGMDVSEIAEIFGGGGHKHAAGFSVGPNHILSHI